MAFSAMGLLWGLKRACAGPQKPCKGGTKPTSPKRIVFRGEFVSVEKCPSGGGPSGRRTRGTTAGAARPCPGVETGGWTLGGDGGVMDANRQRDHREGWTLVNLTDALYQTVTCQKLGEKALSNFYYANPDLKFETQSEYTILYTQEE